MIKVSVECRENTRGHLEPGPGQQSFCYLYTWKKKKKTGSGEFTRTQITRGFCRVRCFGRGGDVCQGGLTQKGPGEYRPHLPLAESGAFGTNGRFQQSSHSLYSQGGRGSLIPQERKISGCLFFYSITFIEFLSYYKCSTCSL